MLTKEQLAAVDECRTIKYKMDMQFAEWDAAEIWAGMSTKQLLDDGYLKPHDESEDESC